MFGSCRCIGFVVVDIQVGVDEESLEVFDDFNGDEEGDWHQVRVQDPVSEDIEEELLRNVQLAIVEVCKLAGFC